MKKYWASSFFLLLLFGCNPQQPVATTTTTKTVDTITAAPAVTNVSSSGFPAVGDAPEQFVPAGYFIQYVASGDINQDGLDDVAMVLRQTDDSSSARALVVITQQKSGPGYQLADAGWKAIGPQCREDGYAFREVETLEVTTGAIELKLYDPGPYGNLFSTYRYIDGKVQLVVIETFGQGAGGAEGRKLHLQTGLIEITEINRMKDPEETTETTENVRAMNVLLHDSNPDELMNNLDKSHP